MDACASKAGVSPCYVYTLDWGVLQIILWMCRYVVYVFVEIGLSPVHWLRRLECPFRRAGAGACF
jgi:hypothetical protein